MSHILKVKIENSSSEYKSNIKPHIKNYQNNLKIYLILSYYTKSLFFAKKYYIQGVSRLMGQL